MLDRSGQAISLANLDFVFGINLRGTLDLIRQFLPHLAAGPADGEDGEKGIVIMVSSVAAYDGQMGQVAYAASKGAVASATLPMARDLSKHGIRVVSIAPGYFDTGMTALMREKVKKGIVDHLEYPRRAGRPDEFASLVREAIRNSMLNGTVLRLDGGARLPSKI
jgi:3-hydroxyacyl-CoA dehydrogenase / 3-hydroxy-2-methylbutyryl-CoA dehydrogenase